MHKNNNLLAIQEFKKAIGTENVLISRVECKKFEESTFCTTQKIKGILRPSIKEEVINCVKIANQHKIKLYPLSTGMNIGLGNTVPTADDCFVLVLQYLNKILDFNEELAYIVVEPGVTQAQVVEFLKAKNSNLMLSSTGSLPETSIVGNVLERGDTRGPFTQRAENICRLGVVLADGNYIETGFGRFKNSKTANISKYGVGPDYTGMFLQSNFGIITQLTLWLSPKDLMTETILFTLNTEEQLRKTVDLLLKLKLQNIVTYVDIFNEYKILTASEQFPTSLLGDREKFYEFVDKWRKYRNLGNWNGILIIRSITKECAQSLRKEVMKRLKPIVERVISTEEYKFGFINFFRKLLEFILSTDLKLLVEIPKISIFYGIPYRDAFKSLYWRKKTSVPNNYKPIQDMCGVIWAAIAIPFVGKEVVFCVYIANKIIKEYELEPNISLLGISERMSTMTICIIYDREIEGEDNRAMKCHDHIINEFCNLGYYPNRLGIQSMDCIPAADDHYDLFMKKMKTHFDPNDIISPKRYDFRHNWGNQI